MELINSIIVPLWTNIFPLSLKSGIFILLYLLARMFIVKKASPRLLSIIWFVIFVRLCIPFEPVIANNYLAVLNIETYIQPEKWFSQIPPSRQIHSGQYEFVLSETGPDFHPTTETDPDTISRQKGIPVFSWLTYGTAVLWLGGVFFFLIKTIIINLLFFIRHRRSRIPVPRKIHDLFAQVCKKETTQAVLEISTTVQVPCASGLFKPKVIFPAPLLCRLDEEEIKHIFLHELVHIKRMDMLSELLLTIAGIIYWFHPLIHMAASAFRNDRECACDADAMLITEGNERIRYGKTILRLITIFSTGRTPECTLGIMDRKQHISRRLLLIKQKRKKRPIMAIAAAAVFIPAALFFTTKTISADDSIKIVNTEKILFAIPVSNPDISLEYGWAIHPFTGKKIFHNGMDMKMPVGTPVKAVSDGKVIQANTNSDYGMHIIIEHADGYTSVYSKLSSFKAKQNQQIRKGDVIGLSGNSGISTGPHLHFMILHNNESVNPRKVILFK